MGRQAHKVDKHPYLVIAPLNTVIVRATDEEAAKLEVLRMAGHASKPYLARDWMVREATPAEIERYAVWADNWRPSVTPERRAIEARRRGNRERLTTQRRLV